MAQEGHAQKERSKAVPDDPLLDAIASSVKVGLATGTVGFLFGGAAGIVRGAPPILFAGASAFQTFAIGTTYWGSRSAILQLWKPQQQTPSDSTIASAISGGFTGAAVGFLTRGRSHAIPGAIMFTLFGLLGQTTCNAFTVRRNVETEPRAGFWVRMSEKRFSPFRAISNEEYAKMLTEKMLKVDVEVAIIDDKITALRKLQQEQVVETATPKQPDD